MAVMRTISWRGSRIDIKSQTVQVGSHQLELRRCCREGKEPLGPPIVAVAGFLESNEVFFARKGEGGLAPFLAALGYDVYLLELRGRGKSWPAVTKASDWSFEENIAEDIPAHLQTIAKLRPDEPQFWLGQGIGSLLLHCAYERRPPASPPLLGMVHFAASRGVLLDSRRKTSASRQWWLAAQTMKLFRGYVGVPFSDPPRRETCQSLAELRQWQREAMPEQSLNLPPSLYIASENSLLWGNPNDTRRWIHTLGPHNARLVAVGKRGGNLRNYNHRELLQHANACDDHFLQLQAWLEEQCVCAEGKPANISA